MLAETFEDRVEHSNVGRGWEVEVNGVRKAEPWARDALLLSLLFFTALLQVFRLFLWCLPLQFPRPQFLPRVLPALPPTLHY